MPNGTIRPALSKDDVARFLGVPASTVLRLVRRGRLRGVRVGRHVRIRPEWLDDYLAEHEVHPRAERDGSYVQTASACEAAEHDA